MQIFPKPYTPGFELKGTKAWVGAWMFRRRGLLPLLLLPLLVSGPPSDAAFHLPFALLLFITGEGLRLWAVGYAGRVTRTRADRSGPLVTVGPFAYMRNPIYLGNIANALGAVFLYDRVQYAFWVGLGTLLYYDLIVAFEEQLLQFRFGEKYDRYRMQIPRWLPCLHPYDQPSRHRFLLKYALFSERGTFGVIALLWLGYLLLCLGS
jgi:protein-S-isoprenylcysteine O-methyltransferase Ste14